MHDKPAPAQPRPSSSSRRSSAASTNKPLPPEPIQRLFSPVPSSKPQPGQSLTRPLSSTSRQSPAYRESPHSSPKTKLEQPFQPPLTTLPGNAQQVMISQPHEKSWKDLKQFSDAVVSGKDRLTPLSTYNLGRPISSTPTAIIESYSHVGNIERLFNDDPPLFAPSAQSPCSPIIQEERLRNYENFDPDVLSPGAESIYPDVTDADNNDVTGGVQRKDTLAYRFDTPTESDPQIVFQQPAWADSPVQAADDIALKYRNTLMPSPFSSASPHGDEETASTPTIPVLPPLPVNSPFRFPLESNKGLNDVNELHPTGPSPKPRPARHSPAESHEESYRPVSVQAHDAATSRATGSFPPREFGSQASWEPGDDAAGIRAGSMTTERYKYPSALGTLSNQLGSSFHHQRHQKMIKISSVKSTPPAVVIQPASMKAKRVVASSLPVLNSSVERQTSAPSLSPVMIKPGHISSKTVDSFVTDTYDDEERLASHWSDDSDEEDGRGRSLSQIVKRRHASTKRPGTGDSTASANHNRNANTLASRDRVELLKRDRAASTGGKRHWNRWGRNTEDGDRSSDVMTSLHPDRQPARTSEESNSLLNMPSCQDSTQITSTPPAIPQTPSSPETTAYAGSPRKVTVQKSQTWHVNQLELSNSAGLHKASKPPKTEPDSWFSKMRKKVVESPRDDGSKLLKKKDRISSEKWREELKSKIRVVHGEPQGMMAIVATQEMVRNRARANTDGNSTNNI